MSNLKKIVIGLGCAVAVMGCVNIYLTQKDKRDNEDVPKGNEAVTTDNHKIGDITTLDKEDKVSVSVKGCRKTVETNPYTIEMDTKDNVDRYIIDVEIANNSDLDIEHDAFNNFEIKDNEGYVALTGEGTGDVTSNQGLPYINDTTRPGETSAYEIVCKVKKGSVPSTIEIDLGLDYYAVFDLEIN